MMVTLVILPIGTAEGAWIGFFGKQKFWKQGDPMSIYAGAFFPRYLCKKKIKFRLKDSAGHKFRMRSLKTEAEGIFTSRQGSPYIGDVPNEAVLGRARLRGRQKCGPVLGKASDTRTIYIALPGGRPTITAATAPDVIAGKKTELKLRISMMQWTLTYLTVGIDYEVLPGLWQQVDTVTTSDLIIEGGTYRLPWRAKLDSAAPAGRYRFNVSFKDAEFQGGVQVSGTAEFSVASEFAGADQPLDGALSPSDQLIVGDPGKDALLVYDERGRLVTTYSAAGLLDPKDLDFGPDGKMYVADFGNKRIAILSPTGEYVDSYGELEAFSGRRGPDGIAVDAASNRIYVADRSTGVVYIFPLDSDTQTPQEIEIPEFQSPQDVDVAADGSLYVADENANKVFHLTSSGTLIGELADFGGPARSVSVAQDGRIYVVAGQYVGTPTGHYEHEVWVFARDGTLVDRLGRALLRDTSGVVAAGIAGDVYVMEQNLGRLYRFRSP